jgi:hypothetical protein
MSAGWTHPSAPDDTDFTCLDHYVGSVNMNAKTKKIPRNVLNFCHDRSMDNVSVEVSDNSGLTKSLLLDAV